MKSVGLLSYLFPKRSLGRFLSVGALNTIIGVSLFPLLYWLVGQYRNINVVLIVSYIFCTSFAFAAHKFVTFQSHGKSHIEGAKFLLVSLITYLLNLGMLNAMLPLMPFHPVILQLAIAVTLQVFNFFILGRVVFPSLIKGKND